MKAMPTTGLRSIRTFLAIVVCATGRVMFVGLHVTFNNNNNKSLFQTKVHIGAYT